MFFEKSLWCGFMLGHISLSLLCVCVSLFLNKTKPNNIYIFFASPLPTNKKRKFGAITRSKCQWEHVIRQMIHTHEKFDNN